MAVNVTSWHEIHTFSCQHQSIGKHEKTFNRQAKAWQFVTMNFLDFMVHSGHLCFWVPAHYWANSISFETSQTNWITLGVHKKVFSSKMIKNRRVNWFFLLFASISQLNVTSIRFNLIQLLICFLLFICIHHDYNQQHVALTQIEFRSNISPRNRNLIQLNNLYQLEDVSVGENMQQSPTWING